VISAHTLLCVGGCGNLEEVDRLFLHYDFYRQIRNVVYNWLDFIMVNMFHISNHLINCVALGVRSTTPS